MAARCQPPEAKEGAAGIQHKTSERRGETMATKSGDNTADAKAALEGTRIKWDDTGMKSSYANVCNVTSTREEVVLLFGMNQAWNRGQKEVTIQLTDRVVVSPYAAKRLSMLLQGVVSEYEKRFGTLNIDLPASAAKK
jgi:ethanolamine utilization microcompartment shell protein EutL